MRKRVHSHHKYIGFNDRPFIFIGVPILALFASIVFCKESWAQYWDGFGGYYIHALMYTSAYWIFNRTLMVMFRRRFPSIDDTLKRNALQILVVLITGPMISSIVHNGILGAHALLDIVVVEQEEKNFVNFLTTYVMIFMIIATYEAAYFFKQYKKAIVVQEKIRTEHANAQLVNLRNQVNPHFLFNSLNTLMSLIPSEADHAHQYLSKLSRFYRNSVSETSDMLVPLDKELENVGIYFDLIKERFGSGLIAELDLQGASKEHILPMSLQLLVENAVKHNIVSKDDPLRIHIYKLGDYVHVENNIQMRITETASTGMGLKNIRMRVELVSDLPMLVDESNGLFKVSLPIIVK